MGVALELVPEVLGYSERGFINALLYEIGHRDSVKAQALIAGLLKRVKWFGANPQPGLFDKCQRILVEQSFSELGVADALLLFGVENRGAAVFCEGKRGQDYQVKDAWDTFIGAFRNQKGFKGLTSNLFCQLYFKQRLVGALTPGSREDVDTGLTFELPFSLPRKGRKIGENPVVLRSVKMLKEYLDEVYYLMMIPEEWTTDLENWWKTEVAASSPTPMQWDLSRWGVITIPDIVKFCEDNDLKRTLNVVRHNKGQLYLERDVPGDPDWAKKRKIRGVSVIYAPKIEPKTCLHFSWDGQGCALRGYISISTNTTQPKPNRFWETSQVVPMIEKEFLYLKKRPAIERVAEWREIIEKHNKDWGIGQD